MAVAADPPLSLAEHTCLSIIGEAPTHGWSIVRLLDPGGELGRIWSLSRPLTYRAIDQLAERGLIERTNGGRRTVLTITRRGRAVRRRWLTTPVAHLRDVRTEFVLKVALSDRAGHDRRSLVERQLDALDPAIDALTVGPRPEPVDLWRSESALAVRRFLERLLDDRRALRAP